MGGSLKDEAEGQRWPWRQVDGIKNNMAKVTVTALMVMVMIMIEKT